MANLPSAYQEVEYIESSGTQRIDTGIRPDDTTYWLVCKINLTSISWDWTVANLWWPDINHYRYGINWLRDMWQPANIMTESPSESYITWATTWTDYEVSFNYNSDRSLIVNWSTLKSWLTTWSYTYGVNWNIFTWAYWNWSYGRYGSFKLYSFQIYKGTTLLRDFVPCYRKNDSVIWLYDLVWGLFYTNAGTWTFTKWLDVIKPLINHWFIGTWHKELGRRPWVNTIAYYPLKWDLNDYSGNGYNAESSWGTITYPNNKYADFSAAYARFPNGYSSGTTTDDITISLWARDITSSQWEGNMFVMGQDWFGDWWWALIRAVNSNNDYSAYIVTWWAMQTTSAYNVSSWVWHHFVETVSPTNREMKFYIDWVLKETVSINSSMRIDGKSAIGKVGNYTHNVNWDISEIINERKARTAQEILDYYNQTKANYWL